ncbi:MAG TPA: galactose-1-phosphate uridylyltransferase [Actinobacteria bacterium]|nr:galactose-1-phosphate uridylyltransferase [Actinomycetota bacterium]
MSEIRRDPISNSWIILATERAKRSSDFAKTQREERTIKSKCPFCGKGEMTEPPGPFAVWPGEKVGEEHPIWKTRVLPNKFPALSPKAELIQGSERGLYHFLGGAGGHEVIVESPEHEDTFATMHFDQLVAIINTYTHRYKFWKLDPRVVYVLVFRNYKGAAGASLSHPHSQVIATPIIPPRISEEMEQAKEDYDRNERCVFCDILKMEMGSAKRKVFENETMFAFCPYASRFPFEVCIAPKEHAGSIEDLSKSQASDLAETFSQVFRRLTKLLNDPAYNFSVHVAPLKTPDLIYYHWHIEILPRLTIAAGFEWGSGIYINVVSPEAAAKELKEAG